MPTSWYQAIPILMERIIAEHPASILDVGAGFGKYGVLLRESFDIPYERYDKKDWQVQIDGVEAFAAYRNPLHDYAYNTMYYQPLEECLPTLGDYDVILLIDVLETMHKEQGLLLLEQLLAHTKKALIISTPINPLPQGEYMGNSFEVQRSSWTPVDFANFENDFTTLPILEHQALIVKLYPTAAIRQQNVERRARDEELLELLENPPQRQSRLHIAYALPHRKLTGGLKMLLEQIRWLKSRGHIVDVYLRDEVQSALPSWMPVPVDRDVVIHGGYWFHPNIQPCDVIVSGWYEQLPDLLQTKMPVMYWEQGNEMIFGDFWGKLHTEEARQVLREQFSSPVILTSVSDSVAELMERRYNRKTAVILNGVDVDFFQPAEKGGSEPIILLVGSPGLPFKRFTTALKALQRLWDGGRRFRVRWICQSQPNSSEYPFPTDAVVHAPQEQLAQIYASADIFISASIYEGFGMPALEAMASGLAVICTDCGGPRTYLQHEQNALVVRPEDENAIVAALERLMDDESLRQTLAANARATALNFSLDKSYQQLEAVLYAIREQNEGK